MVGNDSFSALIVQSGFSAFTGLDAHISVRSVSGLKVYRGIRNSTKGGYDEIAYRMKKYAAKYDIQFKFPFDYACFALDKRTRRKSFVRCLKVLQALENMRFYSLFFRAQCKSKVIKSVMTGNHPIIQSTTIEELKNNIYDWNTGMQIKNARI